MHRTLPLVALALVAIAPAVAAQRAPAQRASAGAPMPLEIGFDGAVIIGTGGTNNEVEVGLPRSVRVGFHVSPAWSIEPSLALSRRSDDDESITQYVVGVGALYHFSPVRTATQFYARPFLNVIGFSEKEQVTATTTVTVSDNVTEFGAGLGVKMPWRDRLAWRAEANVSRLSDQTPSGQTRVGLLLGMSYFTR